MKLTIGLSFILGIIISISCNKTSSFIPKPVEEVKVFNDLKSCCTEPQCAEILRKSIILKNIEAELVSYFTDQNGKPIYDHIESDTISQKLKISKEELPNFNVCKLMLNVCNVPESLKKGTRKRKIRFDGILPYFPEIPGIMDCSYPVSFTRIEVLD